MDYYLNEYSLRGQFCDVDDFLKHLREDTLPVLKRIQQNKENIIWKKDNFWKSEICENVTLTNIPQKKNERSAEMTVLKAQIVRLAYEDPFWEYENNWNPEDIEYKFDEEYRDYFEEINCFTKAIENEGRIISFFHPAYLITRLPVAFRYGDCKYEYGIDNIYNLEWWKKEPEIKKWKIGSKYSVEVRANEFDYHPPHFHVSHNEYAAVFKLNNGELYKHGNKKWENGMITEVREWYQIHKDDLQEAWRNLHENY